MMAEKKRNYEFRGYKTCPHVLVSRDGEVKFKKGHEQYRGGMLRRPEEFIQDAEGKRQPIQWMIWKTFPDIPLRHVQKDWK
jgi:hypothetical protein